MGRTVLPYSQQIEIVRDRFRKFRRALRKADQALFDEIMLSAKIHIQAGVMAACPNPADGVFLSVLLEMQRKIKTQEHAIASLCRQVEEIQRREES